MTDTPRQPDQPDDFDDPLRQAWRRADSAADFALLDIAETLRSIEMSLRDQLPRPWRFTPTGEEPADPGFNTDDDDKETTT